MLPTQQNNELLDSILQHVTEDDWEDGLDLYQAGRVNNAIENHGLILGTVSDKELAKCEVRIKIHPVGNCIQWIECTCKKNRVSGRYCEHIAAVMMHIDREQRTLFQNLDKKMPLKPPSAPKVRTAKSAISKDEQTQAAPRTFKSRILDQLKGSISNIQMVGSGPKLRVKLEIREGHMTHYDLELDDAAEFLAGKPKTSGISADVLALKVSKEIAEIGTVVYAIDNDTIIVERAVCIPKRSTDPKLNEKNSGSKNDGVSGEFRVINSDKATEQNRTLRVVPMKNVAKLIGERFVFEKDFGYWPIDKSTLRPEWWECPLKKKLEGDDAVEFLKDGFGELLKLGPLIVHRDIKTPQIIEFPKLGNINLTNESHGWFSLDPRYGDADSSISMAALIRAYRTTGRKYFKQGDAWISIPDIVKEVDWEISEDSDTVRVDNLGLIRLQAMTGDFDAFVGSKHLIEKLRERIDASLSEQPPPLESHTKLNLRAYQQEGYAWLWWLYRSGLHGLLADEMGLGKTHQAMALMSAIQTNQNDAKFLVLCPTTVLDHWLDKVQAFSPNLKPVKYHGAKRLQELSAVEQFGGTIITSYGVILRDIRYFEKVKWAALILDEAHAIKNSDTATYRSVCKLHSQIRVCLSGTPIENNLMELKSIFDFLVPGFLGSNQYFKKNFLRGATNPPEVEQDVALQRLIHPLKLRRTKANVLSDLPEKVEDIRRVSLEQEQVSLYRGVIDAKARPIVAQLSENEGPIPFLHVFATLTLLKQICNHPALVLPGEDWRKHSSGKFELLKELIDEALGSDHKIVIFSQYVSMIQIIDEYLTENSIGHVVMTGQSRNRGKLIETFQTEPNCKIFVGSLLAGGIGIDLTAASVVIHYDRWWNASKENQATDRVHRIGQTKNVQVLKLITSGTLEEKIDAMIRSKQHLFERYMDRDEDMFKNFTRQELIELLE